MAFVPAAALLFRLLLACVPQVALQHLAQIGGAVGQLAPAAQLFPLLGAQLFQLPLGGGLVPLGPAPLTGTDHPDLVRQIALGLLGGVLQAHLHLLPEQVDGGHGAHPVGALHKGLLPGAALHRVLIGPLLVLQAAHQPPAGARDLGGVEGQVLGLGHFDGHRLELVQKLGAAEGLAADAEPPQHPGLVPHADLPQLDAGPEHPRQVLHQRPEIHPAVGGEEEQDLVAVKAVLHLDQLHVQPMALHKLLAGAQGLLLAAPVFPDLALVPLVGQPHHRAQGLHHRAVLHHGVAAHAGAVFQPLARLHDDAPPLGHRESGGVKVVLLSARPEPDADDLRHKRFPPYLFEMACGSALPYWNSWVCSQPRVSPAPGL